MTTRAITVTLTINLEMLEEGTTPTDETLYNARTITETAIVDRLFGEGFLPSDIYVENYHIATSHTRT